MSSVVPSARVFLTLRTVIPELLFRATGLTSGKWRGEGGKIVCYPMATFSLQTSRQLGEDEERQSTVAILDELGEPVEDDPKHGMISAPLFGNRERVVQVDIEATTELEACDVLERLRDALNTSEICDWLHEKGFGVSDLGDVAPLSFDNGERFVGRAALDITLAQQIERPGCLINPIESADVEIVTEEEDP